MSISIKKTSETSKISSLIKESFKEINFIPRGRVYIKPNLSGREPVLPGENTSIEFMDALVDILIEYKCEIIIGHGALLGSFDHAFSFDDVIRSSGFIKYKDNPRVNLVNLDDLERTEVQLEEMTLHLPLDFLNNQVDSYINLAKIKTHMEATVSFSLKNQMGFPAPGDRVMMHKTNLEKTIAKLALHCKPAISILEGFPAMENNGPHHGTPRNLNFLAVGDDMVELDSLVSELLGYNSKEIKHIKYASELGVGKYFDMNYMGKYKDFLVNNFKKAEKVYRFGTRIFAYPTYSCSRCITAVNSAGKEFKKHPFKYWRVLLKAFFSKRKINIVFGKADNLVVSNKDVNICIGNCTKNFAQSHDLNLVDKCPPSIEETREYIIKNLNK